MTEIGRRDFLRAMTGGIIGTSLGYAAPNILGPVQQAVANQTHHSVGNVSQIQKLTARCGQNPTATCYDEYHGDEFEGAVLVAPPIEEAAFRGLPSLILDISRMVYKTARDWSDPDLQESAFKTTLVGSSANLNSTDVAVGLITTTVFAYTHNLTRDKHFVTQNIPVGQFCFGGMAWVLQRKAGLGAATAAHTAINARIFSMPYMP